MIFSAQPLVKRQILVFGKYEGLLIYGEQMEKYKTIKYQSALESMAQNPKEYVHLDRKIGKKQRKRLLMSLVDSQELENFIHLPFITFNISFYKYNAKVKKLVPKTRRITLPSHRDALYLKFYANILNFYYEDSIRNEPISNSVLAYRKEKSNITGAKEVMDFMWSSKDCWVIKGDFRHFFDNLNHQILIRNVKEILHRYLSTPELHEWFFVLNMVEKYRTIPKENLPKYKDNENNWTYFRNIKEMHTKIKKGQVQISQRNKLGIPQGTAISAILANVYMLKFDKKIIKYVSEFGGIYKRYSDDFIIVIPKTHCDYGKAKEIKSHVIEISQSMLHLQIQPSKTALLYFDYSKKKMYKGRSNQYKPLDYLGFSFTGETVYLRSSTLYRYHYRGKHAIHLLKRNLDERRLVLNANFDINNSSYVQKYPPEMQEKVKNRLKSIGDEANRHYSIRGKKKITKMYLVNKTIYKQNMRSYAERAQSILSRKIKGNPTLYKVAVSKRIERQIGYFQELWHSVRI